MFSGKFVRFAWFERAAPIGCMFRRWDRILARVGTRSIPLIARQQNVKEERPAKAAGRSSRFIAQGLRSGASPKKMGAFVQRPSGEQRWLGEGEAESLRGKKRPPGTALPCRRAIADFLRSQLRRIGLGHPLGRDPLRTSMPASQTTPANSIGYHSARSSPVGRLRRWLFARCVSNTR